MDEFRKEGMHKFLWKKRVGLEGWVGKNEGIRKGGENKYLTKVELKEACQEKGIGKKYMNEDSGGKDVQRRKGRWLIFIS